MKKLIIFVLILCTAAVASKDPTKQDIGKAVAAAENWLQLVDAADFVKSWTAAAEIFKEKVTQAKWEESLRKSRLPLGKVEKREMTVGSFVGGLKNFPQGQYVIIQFETDFEKKKGALETTILYYEDEKDWKMVGYYIK